MLVGGHVVVSLGDVAPALRRLTRATGLTDNALILRLISAEAARLGVQSQEGEGNGKSEQGASNRKPGSRS
jgi:hypothetical protein